MQYVLIIGSGGTTKFGFLEEIKKLGRNAVVIDAKENFSIKYPEGMEVVFLQDMAKEKIFEKAATLNEKYRFEAVGTIFEPCIETAAFVREKLHLPGFLYEKTMFARNKALMMRLLETAGVSVPKFKIFTKDEPKEKILSLTKDFKAPFILKPAMACSNLGLRKISSHDFFWESFQKALVDIQSNFYKNNESEDWSKEWLLCEYIDGKEIEADTYIEKEHICFKAVQEKTLIFEDDEMIYENNAVIPTLTFSEKETKNLEFELEKLARTVWLNIAKPSGVKYFNIYSEFRIDRNGKPYCLEFTLRIGGAVMPLSVLKSTGVNTFEIAARTLLGMKMPIPPAHTNKGVCWQMIFSDRNGVYRGVEGLDGSGLLLIPFKNNGDEIKTPQSDYLSCVLAEAENAKKASDMVATALRKAFVLIESPDGKIEKIEIPVSG